MAAPLFSSFCDNKFFLIGKETSRPTACRPPASKIEKGKMIFDTTYKDTFHGEQPKNCPATDLVKADETKPGEFSFRGEKHGHRFFTTIKDKTKEKDT